MSCIALWHRVGDSRWRGRITTSSDRSDGSDDINFFKTLSPIVSSSWTLLFFFYKNGFDIVSATSLKDTVTYSTVRPRQPEPNSMYRVELCSRSVTNFLYWKPSAGLNVLFSFSVFIIQANASSHPPEHPGCRCGSGVQVALAYFPPLFNTHLLFRSITKSSINIVP